jgi:hypothetical protein
MTSISAPSTNHQASITSLSYQIDRYVHVSCVLSAAILVSSTVSLGDTSYFLGQIALLTIIHHSVILYSRKRLKKLNEQNTTLLPTPPSSWDSMISLAWFASFMYAIGLVIVTMLIVYMLNGSLEVEFETRWIATLFVCLLCEVPLLVNIALRCMEERRVLSEAEMGKFHYLPRYT